MADFFVFALLLVLAMAFICAPLLKKQFKQSAAADQAEKNAEIFREQETVMQQQLLDGEIDQQQYDELHTEQQRLLLVDAAQSGAGLKVSGRGGRPLLLTMAVLLPVLSLMLYQSLGAMPDLAITDLVNQRMQVRTEAEYKAVRDQLVAEIDKRLEQRPEHGGYQVTQARLLAEMGQFADSIAHYRKALEIYPEDARLLAEYAQTEYFAAGNAFTPTVTAAMEQSLAIDPQNGTALGLKGIQAYRNDDYRTAITSWQGALRDLPPNSPQADVFKSSISLAAKALGEPLPGLSVEVALSPELELNPSDVVYVFARETGPRPMPVAVVKLSAADLPTTVLLDDSTIMPGGKPLSQVEQVQVVARVSKTGSATPSPGDLEGRSELIAIDGSLQQVKLVVDKMLPLAAGNLAATGHPTAASHSTVAGDSTAAAESAAIQVNVSLSPNLDAASDQVVFVYAREVGGPPMPLAIRRLKAADLPATVVLDDTVAMPGGKPLSAAERVEVVARVSVTGRAMTASGDFIGTSDALDVAGRRHQLDLVISGVVP